MNLLLATRNPHKIREIRNDLRVLPDIEIYTLHDFPEYSSPEEIGASFEENAILKATHAASTLQMRTLSDDSGIVVPALEGVPGVHSARYAGPEATDADNRKKLLKEMEGLEDFKRVAYFECCIALATPEGLEKCFVGRCEGSIALEEKGGNGFGYDPLFIKEGYNQTFGQLSETLKAQVSHRGKALQKLHLYLSHS